MEDGYRRSCLERSLPVISPADFGVANMHVEGRQVHCPMPVGARSEAIHSPISTPSPKQIHEGRTVFHLHYICTETAN